MKFGTGSNAELTQKYERAKVLNDIHTSKPKQTNIPDFQLRYSCKCLARFNRSPIKQEVQAFRLLAWTHHSLLGRSISLFYQDNLPTYVISGVGG